MPDSVTAHPAPLPATLLPEEREVVASMIEATCKLSVAPHSQFASLRNIHANGGTYEDVTPSCTCEDLRLYLYGGQAYTVCKNHHLQDLGRIRRAYATGVRHAR